MEVSWNRATPSSHPAIIFGFSIVHHLAIGVPGYHHGTMDPPVLMARHDLKEEPFPTASMLSGIMFLVLMMIEARPVYTPGRSGEA